MRRHMPGGRDGAARRARSSSCAGMVSGYEPTTWIEASEPVEQIYSMRKPDIAREITSCWISLVPSKIVWIRLSDSAGVARCFAVRSSRDDTPQAC